MIVFPWLVLVGLALLVAALVLDLTARGRTRLSHGRRVYGPPTLGSILLMAASLIAALGLWLALLGPPD